MMTTWILWGILTLITPVAEIVIPVDEFATSEECKAIMKQLGEDLSSKDPDNMQSASLACIPVGTGNAGQTVPKKSTRHTKGLG